MKTGRSSCLSARIGPVAVGLALIAGCANIPTSGVVRSGSLPVTEAGQVYVQADGPSPQASALDIAQGFVKAQAAGVYDDYRVAKEFLTSTAAAAWKPEERTSVYLGEPALAATPDGTPSSTTASPSVHTANPNAGSPRNGATVVVSGHIDLAASLDSSGVYTEASPDASRDLTFTVQAVNGQWRISEVDNGTLVSLPNFTSTYRSVDLAFLSPDHRYIVPDQRWYPLRNLATYAVDGLLAGPASWLQDSVTTAIPAGTTLKISGAVTVASDGHALVDLSAAGLSADTTGRSLMQAQFEATLMQIPQVRGVDVWSGGSELGVSAADVVDYSAPADRPYLVAGRQIGTLDGSRFIADTGFAPFKDLSVTALAIEPSDGLYKGRLAVLRDGTNSLVKVGVTGGSQASAKEILRGENLAAPSIDRFGWVWTASGSSLMAVDALGRKVTVAAPWLTGRTIVAVRVSHDGARIAVVSQDESSSQVISHTDVAGIVRDNGGAPTQVMTPVPVGAPLTEATAVVWLDESTLAVLGRSAAAATLTVHMVPLANQTASQPSADHTTSLAAGWGVQSLYILSTEGALSARSTTGASWQYEAAGVSAVAYPG